MGTLCCVPGYGPALAQPQPQPLLASEKQTSKWEQHLCLSPFLSLISNNNKNQQKEVILCIFTSSLEFIFKELPATSQKGRVFGEAGKMNPAKQPEVSVKVSTYTTTLHAMS